MATVRKDILYPELSYTLVGLLYDVYNELGYGYRESHYERAVAHALEEAGMPYERQLAAPVEYRGKNVGNQYLDFLVDGKIVLELKRGMHFSRKHVEQVHGYLQARALELGIIALFTPTEVRCKRVVNAESSKRSDE